MNMSFYSAARGAMTQQEKINVIANNISNVNTTGFKSKDVVFQDLLHYNMRSVTTENQPYLTSGTGTKVSHINTNHGEGGLVFTGNNLDYAINGRGFFQLENPTTNEIVYTRKGNFYLSAREDGYYLAADSGALVLDEQGNYIKGDNNGVEGIPAVYYFENTDDMFSIGANEFTPVEKNGQPIFNADADLKTGYLEASNVDLAQEIGNTIEASRAYSFILKMMQTSDEIAQTINNLR